MACECQRAGSEDDLAVDHCLRDLVWSEHGIGLVSLLGLSSEEVTCAGNGGLIVASSHSVQCGVISVCGGAILYW